MLTENLFVVIARESSRRIMTWCRIGITDAGAARGLQLLRRSVGIVAALVLAPGVSYGGSDGVNGLADDVYRRDHRIQQYLVGIQLPFPSLKVRMVVLGLGRSTAVILRHTLTLKSRAKGTSLTGRKRLRNCMNPTP